MVEGADNQDFVLIVVNAAVEEFADSEALGEEGRHKHARRPLLYVDLVTGSEMLHGVEKVQTSVGAA